MDNLQHCLLWVISQKHERLSLHNWIIRQFLRIRGSLWLGQLASKCSSEPIPIIRLPRFPELWRHNSKKQIILCEATLLGGQNDMFTCFMSSSNLPLPLMMQRSLRVVVWFGASFLNCIPLVWLKVHMVSIIWSRNESSFVYSKQPSLTINLAFLCASRNLAVDRSE